MNNYKAHQELIKRFMVEVSRQFPNVILIPYTVGMFRAWDNPDRIIRAGQKGVPDLIAFSENDYRFLDAKTGNAVFNKEQKAFKIRVYQVTKSDRVFKLTSLEQGLEIIRGMK